MKVKETDIAFWAGVFVAWVLAALLITFADRPDAVPVALAGGAAVAFLRVGCLVARWKP